MTTQKDFKRVVRSRMQKTGESYTAARAQLLRRTAAPPLELSIKPAPAAPARSAAPDFARLAGLSDVAVKQGTGCGWSNWVKALDHAGAQGWPHRAIAQYLREKYDTPSWWTQMVAVGYERIKGLRERGQQRSGDYRITKSRTVDAPVSRLYSAFRRQKFTVRSATKNRAMRITWPDGTSVVAGFVSKGRSKSQVAIEHSKLESKAAALKMKAYWAERLDTLEV
jgi:hypothetical protein